MMLGAIMRVKFPMLCRGRAREARVVGPCNGSVCAGFVLQWLWQHA